MFTPPMWVLAVVAVVSGVLLGVRLWAVMPRQRVRAVVLPVAGAALSVGPALARHQGLGWALVLYTDVVLLIVMITAGQGELLRRASAAHAAGEPVPQVPVRAAVPALLVSLVLLLAEVVVLRPAR